MDGWMNGSKSPSKDCLQQIKNATVFEMGFKN
jgi:hypothetical protein